MKNSAEEKISKIVTFLTVELKIFTNIKICNNHGVILMITMSSKIQSGLVRTLAAQLDQLTSVPRIYTVVGQN